MTKGEKWSDNREVTTNLSKQRTTITIWKNNKLVDLTKIGEEPISR